MRETLKKVTLTLLTLGVWVLELRKNKRNST